MEHDDFICSVCCQSYNNTDRAPRIVPVCGHTICTTCISDLLAKMSPDTDTFFCPEDRAEFSIVSRDINLFPKNFAILKLTEKRQSKQTQYSATKADVKQLDGVVNSADCTEKKQIVSISNNETTTKTSQDISSHDQSNLVGNPEPVSSNAICKEHNRKFELVCLDHKMRICTNCALFGRHKNHDFRSEEEIFKEITSRAESLIDMFQAIDCKQNTFTETAFREQLFVKVQSKYETLSSQIHSAFETFIDQIRAKERKIIEEVSTHIEGVGEYCKMSCKLPQDLSDKVNRWKNNAQIKLASLDEKTERGEIAFELLEDRYNLKEDILNNGEKILREMDKSSQTTIKSVDDKIEKISVVFSDTFPNMLEKLCILKCEDSSPENLGTLTIDDDFSKRLLTSGNDNSDIGCEKIPQHDKTTPQPGQNQAVDAKLLFDSKLRHFESMVDTPLSGDALSQLTDDTNLLNFEAPNFNMLDGTEYGLDQRQNLGYYPGEVWKANEGTPVNSAPILHRNPHELLRPADSSVLTLRDVTNIPLNSGFVSPNQQTLQNNMRLDLRSVTSKANSQNNSSQNSSNNSSNQVSQEDGTKTKLALTTRGNLTKRKATLKVHAKFEPIIEGFRDGTLEAIDLTGAELGDGGVALLAEWLVENKKLKALKLVRNKISDEGFALVLRSLAENTTLTTLNMTQNQLTEKSLDALINLVKVNPTVKNIYFNQNLIKVINVKTKIKEMQKLGINISI